MDYADEIMKMFKSAQFFSPISKENRNIAKAMAPHMPGMGAADISSLRGYMGDVFKSNSHLRGVLAGEKGATQRQNIAGDYGVQLQNMRNISDQILQSLRGKQAISLEQERGYNDENLMRLGERLYGNRPSSGTAYPGGSRQPIDSLTWEIINGGTATSPITGYPEQDIVDPVAKEKEKNKFDPFDIYGSIGTGM